MRLEYSGRHPFAQRSNLLRPRFYGLLYDIVDFLRTAPKSLRKGDLAGQTLDQYVVSRRYSKSFRNHFLVPLTAALWSTAPNLAGVFPIEHAVRFFHQHGMLDSDASSGAPSPAVVGHTSNALPRSSGRACVCNRGSIDREGRS